MGTNKQAFLLGLVMISFAIASPGAGQDSAQWLGNADHNGVAGTPLGLSDDPETVEPDLVWKKSLGSGYSSPIVFGDQLVILYTDGKNDLAACLEATSGTPRWMFELGPYYKGHDGSIDGPLSSPATDGEVVVALSGHGRLHALRLKDGTSMWDKDLPTLGGRKPYFGFSSSPLLDGDRVYVLSGGDEGKCVLAFNKDDGALIWSSGSEEIEYSSPTLAVLDGVPQLIIIGKNRTTSVAASNGNLLWTLDAKPDGWATPLALPGDRVFLPLAKQLMLIQCRQYEGKWDTEVVWSATGYNGNSYSFGYRKGHLYGVSKRRTVCLEVETGEAVWSERSKESTAIVAGEHLVSLSRKKGILRIIQARPDGPRELLRYEAFPDGAHWTVPTAANGLLYLRSGSELAAYRLKQGE